jgi:dipeptidyl aminopeptidase/acylaminoacyl peptidase
MPPAEPGPAWQRRFTAPTLGFPTWSSAAPERLAVVTNASGSSQAEAIDRSTGERRRLSDEPTGVEEAFVAPDGERVVWFHDPTGEEIGRWVAVPFGGGEPRPLAAGVPDAWTNGVSVGRGAAVVATADEDGSTIWVARGAEPAVRLYRHREPAGVGPPTYGFEHPNTGGLSADGALLAIWHSEHGEAVRPALKVLDASTGDTVADLHDPGRSLYPAAWSPVAGDPRLAITHEREGIARPAIWDPVAGTRTDLALDLPGEIEPVAWWPDGSALLLRAHTDGRDRLFRLAPGGSPELACDPGGFVSAAGVRPDGEVWLRAESGAHPPVIRTAASPDPILRLDADPPPGRPFRPFTFTNPSGDRIHGFVVTPEGPGPFPIVMQVHGGPDWHHSDAYEPTIQAYVDHGFAVAMVNYRGSTGYGVAFREHLLGNPGFPEVEDTVAGLDHLVAAGIADPRRAVVAGRSWGGYVTLMALGLQPERWIAGLAIVPVGDYIAAHHESSPAMRAWDRSFMGGTPEELPELYRERSPITYVDGVRAPVLFVAGENDPRCPIGQVKAYVDALRARGGELEVYTYDAGHASLVDAERIRQVQVELDFLRRHVPGVTTTPGDGA